MASKLNEDTSEEWEDTCYICHLHVPLSSRARHEGSYLHQAALRIAATALERLRAHAAPTSEPADSETAEDKEELIKDTSTTFCGSCSCLVPGADRARHARTKTHLMLALDDQVFDELVRGYVDDEDLQYLETASRDPCDEDDGLAVESSDVSETYTCHMCALEIPKAFEDEHELSPRHRGCVSLANTASRRTIAFLTPTRVSVDAPSKTHEENMVALLKAYTGVDIMKQDHTETVETPVEDTEEPTIEVKKRLTSKGYFTEIIPFLQYIGSFYTLIIDDTDYVTIKTEKDTYLRVHVGNFNGLYQIGGTEENQMKCRMCDGYNMSVSYSSKGHFDRLHVMSLGHIKHVLTPIESIHIIRKIDHTHSLCVLCNVFLPTHSVEDHTMRDIQHTGFLAEALERGKHFKESKDHIKFLIYTSPPVDSGYFTRPAQPGYRFGHAVPYGNGTGFVQNASTTFGSGTGQGGTFGQSGTSGHSVPFASSKQSTAVPFGNNSGFVQNASNTFGSGTGQGGTFGQSGTSGHSVPFASSTQSTGATFGGPTKQPAQPASVEMTIEN